MTTEHGHGPRPGSGPGPGSGVGPDPGPGLGARPGRQASPIELESYRRLRTLVDCSHLPPLSRAVVERVIYATADVGYADDLVADETAMAGGLGALCRGAPVIADTRMVAVGIAAVGRAGPVRCGLDMPGVAAAAADQGLTRSAAGILLAAEACGPGAVYVVGNAPTAVRALLGADAGPALVIGLPVGFVDAAASKAALRASGLPALTNRSAKGGSAAAAAALNALLYAGVPPTDDQPSTDDETSGVTVEHDR